jgi:DNA repair protein RadC
MTTQTLISNASVLLVRGEHILDVQILIDSRELFNLLPGKSERRGVKSLASWPFFITAIMNANPPEESNVYPQAQYQPMANVRENVPEYQLTIFDLTTTAKPSGVKSRKHKVEKTLAEIRKLHDELNAQLYAKPTERPSIHSPKDAYDILKPFIGALDHEELWVMNLDTRNRVMNLVKLYQGSVNMSQVRVAEVFRQAIIDTAPSILVAHNHPSMDTAPSPDDVAVTRSIVQAGKLLDIDVLDHLVVSSQRFVSLKELGMGFGG